MIKRLIAFVAVFAILYATVGLARQAYEPQGAAVIPGREPVPWAKVKQIIESAAKVAGPDDAGFEQAVYEALEAINDDFHRQPTLVQGGDGEVYPIGIFGPIQQMILASANSVRHMEPVVVPLVSPGRVRIDVSPSRIDEPDITRILVMRDGVQIPALSSTLALTTMTTAMGAKKMLHAGVLFYPASAFKSGGRVRVIAMQSGGSNIIDDITDLRLRGIQ